MTDRPASLYERLFFRSAELAVPFSGFIEVTRACNLDCVHCYLEAGRRIPMAPAVFAAAMEQLERAGTFYLSVSGGEPFAHPEIEPMLAEMARRGFLVALFTNGTLVTERRAAFLAAATTVAEVNVSLYATDPAIHDAVTRVPGSHAAAVAGLARLAAAGLAVAVKTPVLAENAGEIGSVRAFCEARGYAFKPDPVVTPKNSGDATPLAHRASPGALAVALAQIPRDRLPAGATDALTCNAGLNYFAIDADGTLYPCIQAPVPLGRIDALDLAAVWARSPELRAFRAAAAGDLTACVACGYSGFCDRCPGLALVESGRLTGPSASACYVAAIRAAAHEGSPA